MWFSPHPQIVETCIYVFEEQGEKSNRKRDWKCYRSKEYVLGIRDA